MNRRTFFNFLGSATLGTIIALKLPDTIAPIFKEAKAAIIEIYPKLIEDFWLTESPLFAYLKNRNVGPTSFINV